ncbi:MAG TPA: carbonic anhydrase, partial [Bryobacteraceae bacterium]|nr:carbonic anhydrase [Bryobacteraceae bacterium]
DLIAGNGRFVAGRARHPNESAARLAEVAKAQHPLAAVLACSDSRVPPELVFDQGVGDLFVVRVAGNTADDVAIGSLEYAVEHLGAKVVMVLGHKRCGAVSAAVAGGAAPGHIRALVDALQPAIHGAKGKAGDPVDNAVHLNVAQVTGKLRSSEPILSESVHAGHVKVVGAYYDLDSGKITLLP